MLFSVRIIINIIIMTVHISNYNNSVNMKLELLKFSVRRFLTEHLL